MSDEPIPSRDVPVPRSQELPEGGVDSHFTNPPIPREQAPPADGPRPADGPV